MAASQAETQAREARVPTPALTPVTHGLSARRVEHWLGLPEGAWQRRHLHALRVGGRSFTALGLRHGDLVVVEPGGHEQPGRIVVVRSARGITLKRIPLPEPFEYRMPTVLELPLREKPSQRVERVVGAVIGLLRPTGTGALRPVSLLRSRRPQRDQARRVPEPSLRSASAAARPVEVEPLFETRSLWHRWLALRRANPRIPITPAQLERWERLDASL
jgi:hypothetical protein